MGSNLFWKSLPDRTGGRKDCLIYLLDQVMQMEKIGLISTNLQKRLHCCNGIPISSALVISDTCGWTISHGGVWNLIQEPGNNQRRKKTTQ